MPPKKTPPVDIPAQAEVNSNIVIVELGENTLQAINALTQAIANKPAPIINLKSVDSSVLEALVKGLAPVPSRLEVLKESTPIVAPKPKAATPAEQTPTVTLTQIRELISAKVAAGKTTDIVALLGKHGAKNASTLAEDQFESFYENLTTL